MSTAECACVIEKIGAVHAYLRAHFRYADLLDFHAPVRLMQAGLPPPHGGHHVVRIIDDAEYYAILTREFQEYSPAEITRQLRCWDLAACLCNATIVILARSGMTPLHAARPAFADEPAKG